MRPDPPGCPLGRISQIQRESPGFQFLDPIFIVILYDESEVAGMDENTYRPILLVGNKWLAVEDCTSMLPPIPDPCLLSRDTVNNELVITTTRFSIYGVQGAFLPPPPVATAAGSMPLGENVVRVWHVNNTTMEWSFYDPRPDFADINTLKELVPGEKYWFKVNNDQTALLNEKERVLRAGWNLIVW